MDWAALNRSGGRAGSISRRTETCLICRVHTRRIDRGVVFSPASHAANSLVEGSPSSGSPPSNGRRDPPACREKRSMASSLVVPEVDEFRAAAVRTPTRAGPSPVWLLPGRDDEDILGSPPRACEGNTSRVFHHVVGTNQRGCPECLSSCAFCGRGEAKRHRPGRGPACGVTDNIARGVGGRTRAPAALPTRPSPCQINTRRTTACQTESCVGADSAAFGARQG